MIANITKGQKAVGAIRYDFGPGRRDEHQHPRAIAGTVVGTPMQIARQIDYTASRRPDVAAPIWRASLSLPDEDGVLPDDQWAAMAAEFVERMGYADTPWVAVRHGDDHIHLTVSRVGWDGTLVSDRHDYRRAREACDELEEQHGLVRARDRFNPEGPEVRNNELEAARRRGRGLDGPPPEREELRRIVREVREASRGLGREAFEAGLADAGVSYRANVASTGRMSGYSFTLPGWTDATGAEVWVAASKVAKDLRWSELGPAIAGPPAADIPDPRIALVTAPRAAQSQPAVPDPRIPTPAAAPRQQALTQPAVPEPAVEAELRSPDPAARLLAQWRARAEGQDHEEDVVLPPAPEPVPAWTNTARRPYGRLSTGRLTAEIKRLKTQVEALVEARARAETDIEAGAALATGQSTGPSTRALHQRLALLEEAEPHITAAAHHMALARAADTDADVARTIWRTADALSRRSRWELWKLDTTRAAEEARAKQASARVEERMRTAAAERRAAADADRAVREMTGLPDAGAQLARLREEWVQLLAAARSQDKAAGHTRRDTSVARVAQITAQISRTESQIEQLHQEQELRRTMPEGQRRAEGRARSAAALDPEAAEAARLGALGYPRGAQEATRPRRPGPAAASEQPAHLRQPPPPNRGRGHGL